jgi:hypothetical protein
VDLADVKRRLNRATDNPGSGTNGYSPFTDVNADGRINAIDLAVMKQRLNKRLPDAPPAAAPASPAAAATPPVASVLPASITRDLFSSAAILA